MAAVRLHGIYSSVESKSSVPSSPARVVLRNGLHPGVFSQSDQPLSLPSSSAFADCKSPPFRFKSTRPPQLLRAALKASNACLSILSRGRSFVGVLEWIAPTSIRAKLIHTFIGHPGSLQ
ncbi:hypothetical protein FNV43_RR26542 [Rhamnella rubrinervis]|uniref:Uncharacterized protein n=1 Tax=Rhamnella rubrinervis TaxID=2594499 RepID=A0A8K0DN66_9ROSA|nr:hypothetical protein FNV43_RR26542 [Rhamnella rubrinervis]